MKAKTSRQALLPGSNSEYQEMQEVQPLVDCQKGRESRTYLQHQLQDIQQEHNQCQFSSRFAQLPLSQPFTTKIITMNGETFRRVEEDQEVRRLQKDQQGERLKEDQQQPASRTKSKLPSMLVSCYLCRNVQSIAGTVELFRCGTCDGINECLPTYSFLRCYSCSAKVLFAKGVSNYIKCSKCTTVNETPLCVKDASSIQQGQYQVYYDKESFDSRQGVYEDKQDKPGKGGQGGFNPYEGTVEYYQEQLLSEEGTLGYRQ